MSTTLLNEYPEDAEFQRINPDTSDKIYFKINEQQVYQFVHGNWVSSSWDQTEVTVTNGFYPLEEYED